LRGVKKHTSLLFPAANDKEKSFIKLTHDGGIPLDGVVELEKINNMRKVEIRTFDILMRWVITGMSQFVY
jgi:hypothetical protein